MSKLEYVSEENSEAFNKKIKKQKNKLKACEKERNEYLNGWQRAKADLINFKKEQEKNNSEIFKFANENLILEILPVLDSFELALNHKKDEGIEQLYNQFKNILKSNDLQEIKAIGEKFNPEFHESIGEIKGKKGIIIQEMQKGYLLNGKVVRASRVRIGK